MGQRRGSNLTGHGWPGLLLLSFATGLSVPVAMPCHAVDESFSSFSSALKAMRGRSRAGAVGGWEGGRVRRGAVETVESLVGLVDWLIN